MVAKIAVIGSATVDLVTRIPRMPDAGETLEGLSFSTGFGGKGANQAVAAAKLGASVLMVAKVGDDAFGASVLQNLQSTGVDTRHVSVAVGVSTGVAPIFVEPSGQNRVIIVKGGNGLLRPTDIDAASGDLKDCQLLILQLEIPLETVYHAIAFGARYDIPVILNTAPATAELDLTRLNSLAFLVANESELALLSGHAIADAQDAEKAARMLIAGGIGSVIVTLGDKGAVWVTSHSAIAVPALSVVANDTTGAGDAFIGCFARYYAEADDVTTALTKAAAYAADSITRPGAQQSYASAAEFEAFYRL